MEDKQKNHIISPGAQEEPAKKPIYPSSGPQASTRASKARAQVWIPV